jgi:hypothetical protein
MLCSLLASNESLKVILRLLLSSVPFFALNESAAGTFRTRLEGNHVFKAMHGAGMNRFHEWFY